MKSKLEPPFAFFLIPFIAICIILVYVSNSFCKWYPSDNATINRSENPTIIIIDAGHGGEDGGASDNNGTLEKDLNLSISKKLRDLFCAAGYKVIMTREKDVMLYDKNVDYKGRKKALDLAARVNIANSYENAVFISIHMNSFPDAKYSGLQVYYSENHTDSALMAKNVQEDVQKHIQNENKRKTKPAGSNIFILDRIRIPAILIECGFLSNDQESRLLSKNEYQQKLSLTIFLAISKYIDNPT